jgi:hypothetical protein
MKVKIGKYLTWYGPYQLVDMLFFWHEKYPEDESVFKRWDYVLHERFAKWLASTWVAKVCEWIYNKRKRTIKVHIDNYDVWNMSETLAEIIVPMLKELQKQKHGYGWTDHADGPWYYRFRTDGDEHSQDENGGFSEGRWNWIMSEMIWAFEQIIDENHESRYWHKHGEIDWDAGEPDENGCKPLVWKSESVVDWDGLKLHEEAIRNGTRLFGKYYQNLWD